MIRTWSADQPKKIIREVTQSQAAFLDFIEEHQYIHFEYLEVMKGDPVKYGTAIKQGRFDLTKPTS